MNEENKNGISEAEKLNETEEKTPENEKEETPEKEKEEASESVEKDVPKFRGLYRHVKISVKTLDIIIIVLVAFIIITTIVGLRNPGHLVTYDSMGGTPVEAVKYKYEELIDEPKAPTREGYTFDGWYLDPSYGEKWNMAEDKVKGPMTLYAKWIKK